MDSGYASADPNAMGGGQPYADLAPTSGTAPDPTPSDGQSAPAPQATEPQASEAGKADTEEAFFDPESIKNSPELQAAYKQMQSAFTKRMQGLREAEKANQHKVEAFDAFSRDPIGQLQQIAARAGYRLTRAEAAQAIEQQQAQQQPWEPKSWDEVLERAQKATLSRVEELLQQRLAPATSAIEDMRRGNIERYMDDRFPDWRTYEQDMLGLLQKHPSLSNDPDTLYRMAVPHEVLESRAMQAALKKLQTKGEGKLSGASTTTKAPKMEPGKPLSFDEAVEFARKQLAEKGMKP